MDARQEKALVLAQDKRIKHVTGPTWAVPSQSNEASAYLVNTATRVCSCPDYEIRRAACKHILAVEIVRTVETAPDGSTTTTEKVTVVRKTYVQSNWSAYHAAQCSEKETVLGLLRSLCDGVPTPAHPGRGPKPIAFSDAIYSMGVKVFTGMSARRATTDTKAGVTEGHISRAPHYNSTLAAFDKAALTPVLARLIEESARPLASVETSFAVDSTGFGTQVYRRWFDHKWGREVSKAVWLKAHVVTGVRTNIVTAISVTDSNGADSPELPALIDSTAQRFMMAEVSADKAYLGNLNLAAIESVGATPFIPFKSNSREQGSAAWRRMWGMFLLKQEEFLAHYHQRSNVEATFSAIKRRFGGAVRSKKFTAQTNEILVKVLLHNLTVLVHAMHELGIEPTFGAGVPS